MLSDNKKNLLNTVTLSKFGHTIAGRWPKKVLTNAMYIVVVICDANSMNNKLFNACMLRLVV